MNRKAILLLISLGAFAVIPGAALADGYCIYPFGGYQFSVGGNQWGLDGGPTAGVRLEYNFSRHDVNAVGLVYAFSEHHLKDMPNEYKLDQHFALLGYRFAYNWTWVSVGSMVGTGAVVKDYKNNPLEGTSAEYVLQIGLHMSFRPLRWLEIGPDFSWMLTTNMDKWIFGGSTAYYINLGGHIGIYF